MRIAIGNISNNIQKDEFSATVRAISKQVKEDFAPLWGMTATLRHATISRSAKPDPELSAADVIIYVGETNDDPQQVKNAVGYHSQNHRGVPYGFVFADIAKKVDEPWSTTLSHEVLELIADPDVNLMVVGPDPKKPNDSNSVVLRPYEVCDPVQADSYEIDDIAVSNFVTPLYFAQLDHPVLTQTNYLNLKLERFGVRPGGYFSYYDLAANNWSDVYGEGAQARYEPRRTKLLAEARRLPRHRGHLLGRK
ncbi:MAG TPA: hypothetical protein VHB79_36100 [Polyangiaceae bacterium]|nr:hypothetical protein [Polyangiaceae bacterium]